MGETCVGCAHWKPLDRPPTDARTDRFGVEPAAREVASWGKCSKAKTGVDDSTAWVTSFYVVDCEEYGAALITRPSFGCTEFEVMSE